MHGRKANGRMFNKRGNDIQSKTMTRMTRTIAWQIFTNENYVKATKKIQRKRKTEKKKTNEKNLIVNPQPLKTPCLATTLNRHHYNRHGRVDIPHFSQLLLNVSTPTFSFRVCVGDRATIFQIATYCNASQRIATHPKTLNFHHFSNLFIFHSRP